MIVRYVCSPLAVPDELSAVRGVVFDCDGVLVDSLDANRMYYNLIRERMGLLSMTPEEEEYVHAHSVTKSMARIIPPERLEEAEAIRRGFDYRDIMPYVYLEPGLRELLVLLRQKNVRMGILTNRTNTMDLVLETFDLSLFFYPVVTAGRISHPKPCPEGLHRILAAWELSASQVAYIGDTALDERAARAAGVTFWAYKNPALLAAMHIPNYDSLRQCLRKALPDPGA
ncbi:HAD-IA family hydrolase [Desulfovibrio sulfodismutans]|uniref:phosphoglycolate phosphatase n=1 Tax=Desulfolutivibrio sulfodismutans TaxID=63561 RepID=A0A7K3NII2_9BACT|nr:HAD-IA family hydrolase [Desulfolutivibrio sulfodismutans]QLA11172.1 HAD-IA family hydrolase [Desulfolutivibrio sulfodismutans DSM 3696]